MIARTVSIDRIARTTILFTAALALLCFALGIGDAPSVLLGGIVAVVNLRLIRLLVSRLMTPAAAGSRLSTLVASKFLILLAILAVTLKRMPVDAASFLLGGGSLFVAIVLDALVLGQPVAGDGTDQEGA